MEWLNYHHLYYFWTVAREGSVTRASRQLRLAQPTISAQIHSLEESLGEPLFNRAGRNLVLSDFGRTVFQYADQIFALGRDLMSEVRQRPGARALRFVVGAAEVMPKLLVYRILEPALSLSTPVQMICHEDKPDRLLAEISLLGLDLILSDRPASPSARVRAYSHLLGSCGVTVFAGPKLAPKLRKNFPQSLDGEPFLAPLEGSAIRRAMEDWFEKHRIRPLIAGEFQDSALLKVFGEAGVGFFIAPTPIVNEVKHTFHVEEVGQIDEVQEKFYAISAERKFRHPAVVAIYEKARNELFGGGASHSKILSGKSNSEERPASHGARG